MDQSILQNLDIEPPTEENTGNWKRDLISCFVEGLSEVSGGDKGTLTKCRRENGNMSLFLENRGTKLYKLEDVNEVNKFIKRGTNKENVWEDGNIGQFWKRTREQGPPEETLFVEPLAQESDQQFVYDDEEKHVDAPGRNLSHKEVLDIVIYI